jgi:hypothetical protein
MTPDPNGWIPVTQRLPEQDQLVIAWDGGEQYFATFSNGGFWLDSCWPEPDEDVTHWHPLLTPPGGGSP